MFNAYVVVFAIAILISLVGAYFSLISWKKLEKMNRKDSGKLVGAKCFLNAKEITITFELLYIMSLCYTTLLIFLILDRVFQNGSIIIFTFIAFFSIVTALVVTYAFKTYFDIIKEVKPIKKK